MVNGFAIVNHWSRLLPFVLTITPINLDEAFWRPEANPFTFIRQSCLPVRLIQFGDDQARSKVCIRTGHAEAFRIVSATVPCVLQLQLPF
jgi:hypothetical protein